MESLIYEPSDAGNLGVTVRSAAALGVKRIYVYDTHGLLNRGSKNFCKFRRASMGAYSLIEVATMGSSHNLQRLLEEYKGRKIATVCDDGESSDLQNFVCQENDLVMIGNEQFGLPMEIINGANIHKLSIQMQRKLNSLNISCAFSIISYEYMRQGRLHFTDK